MPKIAIVIVNWNTGPLLARCVQSLLALPVEEQALLSTVQVVDNASVDDSFTHAQAAVAGESGIPFHFIPSAKNLGFAGGNNRGLTEVAVGSDAPHVLLLNPDTEVHGGALPALLEVLTTESTVGVVGPKLVNPDGSLQLSVRPFPRFSDFVAYMVKLGRLVQSRQEQAHDYSQAGFVDQVMGAAFLIRNTVREQIGELDEDFFTLFEEVDYCRRAKDAGFTTYYTPTGTVMHVKAASFNQLVGWHRTWPWIRSALHYADKHLSPWQATLLRLLLPATFLLTIPATIKHLLLKRNNKNHLK